MKVADLQRATGAFPVQPGRIGKTTVPKTPAAGEESSQVQQPFGKVLTDSLKENQQVRFSAHAMRRLEERQVALNEDTLHRLDSGLRQLDAKGSRNSVIFLDDTAFVVSVKNKTVVTAVQKEQPQGNVFTNIDSVAIV